MDTEEHKPAVEAKGYRSFLMRLWQVEVEKKTVWRFSLEDSVSGQKVGFANIAEMMSYLMAEICKDKNPDLK